jgi:outer membrane protein, multidrug efflux system
LTFALFAVLLACCASVSEKSPSFEAGPDYQRPEFDAPPSFRDQIGPAEAASIADLPWWQVFSDPKLAALIAEALQKNYDLQVAVARIQESRALVGVAASQFFPQLGYEGDAQRAKELSPVPGPNVTLNLFTGLFNMAWEIDLWGRIRRSTEAARANLLAAEYARRGVMLTLVSNVAAAYFELVELDRQLKIARDSSNTYSQTLTYFTRRFLGGTDTKLSTSRAEASLEASQATIASLQIQIAQQENAISVLLGSTPKTIERAELPIHPMVDATAGQTTVLLKRRPDILQAEQSMISANAQVGVAVANFFPVIGLSALYGGQSESIGDILKTDFGVWSIGASVTGPLFQGGRLYESYRAQQAFWDETVAQYQATIIEAFREVSDALVAQQLLAEKRSALEKQVAALSVAVRLSLDRYNIGLARYYEVLEAEQELYPAEDTLAQTERDQSLAVVSLYQALGGGWRLSDQDWTPPR